MSSTEGPPLRILHQDDHLLAVDKPCGMPVQDDPSGDASLTTLVAQLTSGLAPAHRLDRPVSGVVLFARTPEMSAKLSALFRARAIGKIYWAVVEGKVEGEHRLEHALQRDGRARKSRLETGTPAGARSMLHLRTLSAGDRYSLLEVSPGGGAFHQIRAQLAAWGHPIKGDVKYGARRGERGRDAAARSIALHARSVTFDHPATGESMTVTAPAPEGRIWQVLLELAGIAGH
ncbi:MAG: RluA family pseudouridine synthase [Flavobacteriales bacterium]|nr:RluA family pseudouridine synthase [Flavobacteriales bacterium]